MDGIAPKKLDVQGIQANEGHRSTSGHFWPIHSKWSYPLSSALFSFASGPNLSHHTPQNGTSNCRTAVRPGNTHHLRRLCIPKNALRRPAESETWSRKRALSGGCHWVPASLMWRIMEPRRSVLSTSMPSCGDDAFKSRLTRKRPRMVGPLQTERSSVVGGGGRVLLGKPRCWFLGSDMQLGHKALSAMKCGGKFWACGQRPGVKGGKEGCVAVTPGRHHGRGSDLHNFGQLDAFDAEVSLTMTSVFLLVQMQNSWHCFPLCSILQLDCLQLHSSKLTRK